MAHTGWLRSSAGYGSGQAVRQQVDPESQHHNCPCSHLAVHSPGRHCASTSAEERPRAQHSSLPSESSGLVASITTWPAANGPSERANAAQAESLANALPGTVSRTAHLPGPPPAHSTASATPPPAAAGCACSAFCSFLLLPRWREPYMTAHPAASRRAPRVEPTRPAPMMAARFGEWGIKGGRLGCRAGVGGKWGGWEMLGSA